MVDRYDALTVRESNGKSFFTKIGVAFPSRSGNGFSVLLDAMPAPTDGQFKILLMEPKPPREQADQKRPAFAADYTDDVPGF